MRYNVEYSVGSEDGRNIGFKKEETYFNGATVTINFRHIALVIIIVIAIVIMGDVIINTNNTETAVSSAITEQGFVFEDSDIRLITSEEIDALKNSIDYSFDELLALSRNEIYARHGQVFKEGEFFDLYYGQYDWYKETYKHNVNWSTFNDIEKANLRLLISAEKEYGFRE